MVVQVRRQHLAVKAVQGVEFLFNPSNLIHSAPRGRRPFSSSKSATAGGREQATLEGIGGPVADLARATTSGCAVKAAGAFCLRYNVSRTSPTFSPVFDFGAVDQFRMDLGRGDMALGSGSEQRLGQDRQIRS